MGYGGTVALPGDNARVLQGGVGGVDCVRPDAAGDVRERAEVDKGAEGERAGEHGVHFGGYLCL